MEGKSCDSRSSGCVESGLTISESQMPPDSADSSVNAIPATPSSPLKILVVDDGVSAADMLALFFELEGFNVRKAYDGLQGVQAAREMKPDVIFLDLGMPRMDGYAAAREIRSGPDGRTAVLVALTGWGEDDDRQKTLDAGFNHHLVKPVEPSMLRALLAELFPSRFGTDGDS
jgi:CheY-like chemotaxis protein